MANVVERAGNRRTGGRAHNALWWVVRYEGARDYARSVHDAPESTRADIAGVERLVDSLRDGTPAPGR